MKREQNISEKTGSCVENRQKLHISNLTCIENLTFLYMTPLPFYKITKMKLETNETPSFKEDHISQIPALQMLVNLGCINLINQKLLNKANTFIVQNVNIEHQ